ncbi:DNA-3-methyladenine glycosylase [Actinomycetaceae bacterium L2_0104]
MIDLAASPLEVAPQLLGATLTANGVGIRVTEVEAYCGGIDPGSHAFRGRTARNNTMFLGPGHLYVYFTYGMHFCINVVCWPEGEPGACLIRAGEVVAGEDIARERRSGVVRSRDLARGPANLARSLAISREADGSLLRVDGRIPMGEAAAGLQHDAAAPGTGVAALDTDTVSPDTAGDRDIVVDLDGGGEYAGANAAHVSTGPRVGVSGVGGDGEAYPWRFWLTADPTVSAYKRGGGSRTRRGQASAVAAREGRLNPRS